MTAWGHEHALAGGIEYFRFTPLSSLSCLDRHFRVVPILLQNLAVQCASGSVGIDAHTECFLPFGTVFLSHGNTY
jgi:hypothetical protein